MISNFKGLIRKVGIDEAIFYTILSRIIQAGGGLVTLIFVARSLSKVEQGYYYTFGSILAIQVFFELGLSNIITQFVAHESINIQWTSKFSFVGSDESASRLSSLLRFTLKWFGIITILLFFGLLLAGYIFFNKYSDVNTPISWQLPWIILSLTTSLSLLVSPILAFFEGLGMIKEVTKVRLFQQGIQLLLALGFFMIGFKLFSVPISLFISFLVIPVWIFSSSKIRLLKFLWSKIDVWVVNYKKEIFPYQWKIALSWISGYFIFQLFNPVLFATEGAVVAGQMGMTLTVINAIFSLAFSWMSTKIPIFSGLIARRDYNSLDTLFSQTLKQSAILNGLALSTFYILICIIKYLDLRISGRNFADRFLPLLPMMFMIIPIFLNHIIGSWATYMRCHKEEPMLLQSIVIGFLCSISTIILGNYFGVIGITFGYMILTILSFIWTYATFLKFRRDWH